MAIEKVIVLEDELVVRKSLEQLLRNRRYDVAGVGTLADAQDYLARDTWDLMFVDVRLPDGQGTDLLEQLQHRPQRPLVVIMTGFGSVESAVECMRNGAFDYLIKPFSPDQIEVTLQKAEQHLQLLKVSQHLSREDDEAPGSELLGKTPAMEHLRQLIRKVAPTQATILIQGESGTGKELVARAIYRLSPRANAPFIRLNCAAVPENLIESEFFGHEKGAFTGALSKREGRFELAHGGTLLLDEVSEISPTVQAKLLRVLQEREFERVGGNRTIQVDVRVIATTNRRLEQSVERGEFREDLYFRLNVVPIHVPPLRERLEDVPYLAEQFAQRYGRKHGVRVRGLSPEAFAALLAHRWPGNVRELQNVIERAVILCGDAGVLEPEHLGLPQSPGRLAPARPPTPPTPGPAPSSTPMPTSTSAGPSPGAAPGEEILSLAELEKRHILATLDRCGWNRTRAAQLLGISSRTLRNKLHEYKMTGKDEPSAASAPPSLADADETASAP